MKKEKKPIVKLVSTDGNAMFILGECARAAKDAKWAEERIQKFKDEATAGDYNHLLRTCCEHFDVR
jgi:hypothetical protein